MSNRLPKPDHIEWSILTREKFENIGVLKELQFKEKKTGKDVKLADGFEDVGPEKDPNELVSDTNGQHINGFAPGSDNKKVNKRDGGKYSKRTNQRRGEKQATNQRNKHNKEMVGNENGVGNENSENKNQERRNKRGPNNRNPESIGIFVGRIPRTARVKELKEAIQERGLRTNNLVWKGVKGFAFLYFDKSHTKLTEEEICLKLKDLKLGETILNIEPDKRKDKGKGEENETQDRVGENGSNVENVPKIDEVSSTKENSTTISCNGVGPAEEKKTIKNSPSKKVDNKSNISVPNEQKSNKSNGDTAELEGKIEKMDLKEKSTSSENNVKVAPAIAKNKNNVVKDSVSPKAPEPIKKVEKNEDVAKITKHSPKKETPVKTDNQNKTTKEDKPATKAEKVTPIVSKSSDKDTKTPMPATETKSTDGKTESKPAVLKKSEDSKEEPMKKEAAKELQKTEAKSSGDGVKVKSDVEPKASSTTESAAKKEEKPKSASATKKEKSKTPDKEVKKEESGGGGFFGFFKRK